MTDADIQEDFEILCPYCGEEVEVHIEADVVGTLVQDCEVCCNPWLVRLTVDGETQSISVTRADGSD